MSDNSRATAATITGAVIGGIAGYFFFTDRGRELRRQFEPALDDCARELNSFRLTVEKAAGVAQRGLEAAERSDGAAARSDMRYPSVNQTSPF